MSTLTYTHEPTWQDVAYNSTLMDYCRVVNLTLISTKAVAEILTLVFGYKLFHQRGNCSRFITDDNTNARIVELNEDTCDCALRGRGNRLQELLLHVRNKDFSFSIYMLESDDVLFEFKPASQFISI